MRKSPPIFIILLVFILLIHSEIFAQSKNVGIGTNNPDNSAILHLDVSNDTDFPTKRGLLIPVMNTAQRNAIVTPAKGLLVFVTDDNNFYFNSGTPASPVWTVLISGLGNVSFANISSGTNITAAMLVGDGASLAPTGTGYIQANRFVGSGSTSDAIDLATTEVNGILPIANGGTGLGTTPTNGQLLIGNGTGYSLTTLTEGTGIDIVNAAGSITISTDATAIDHNSLDNLELAQSGVTWGHIDDQAQTIAGAKTFSSNLTAPVFISNIADGTAPFIVTSLTKVDNLNADMLDSLHAWDFVKIGETAGGDLSGTYPDPTVVAIQGKPVVSTAPILGQILRFDGTKWDLFGSEGIVASVTLNMPTNEFNVAQTFISNNVDINATWDNQSQNLVFASPDGSAGTPSFRSLVENDLPSISVSKLTGILPIANGGTGLGTAPTAGQILIGEGNSGIYALKSLTEGTGITITSDATTVTITADNNGTVTSVGLALPSEFSVSGSPVETSGTLTGTWVNQNQNLVFASPNGSTGSPSFRSLVDDDIPNNITITNLSGTNTGDVTLAGTLDYITIANQVITRNAIDLTTDVAGILPITYGGTELGTTPTDGQLLIGNTSTGKYNLATLTQGSGITITNGNGSISIAANNTGTVTSVGLDLPNEFVEGPDVTTSGDLTATWATQSANKVFAGPSSGGDAAPTFRTLVIADLPTLSFTDITGTLPITKGGTGVTSLPQGMLKGDGTNAISGITAETNQVTFWSDGNTISGHDSLTWDSSTRKFSIGGDLEVTGIIDPKALILIPQASAPTTDEGALWYDAATDKLKIITGSGTETILTGSLGAASGDLSGTYPNLTVEKIQGIAVSTTDPTNGQILKYDGTEWAPADPSGGAETDPEVSMTTSDAIAKWNGTTLVDATSGTDYLAPFGSQTANTVFAAPSGGDGTPSFRSLVVSDFPAFPLGMLKGNGTSAISAVNGTTAGNLAYWSDANTIADDDDLNWNSGTSKLSITGNLEAKTATLTPQASDPSITDVGSLYYNSTDNAVKVYYNSQWNDLGTKDLVVMSAYLSSSQVINDNSWTKITFNSEEFDSHNAFSTGTFTAPIDGYFNISACIEANIQQGTGNYLEIAIYVNGSIYSKGKLGLSPNNDLTNSCVNQLIKLSSGNTVSIYVYMQDTADRAASGSASKPYVTYLTIHQVK